MPLGWNRQNKELGSAQHTRFTKYISYYRYNSVKSATPRSFLLVDRRGVGASLDKLRRHFLAHLVDLAEETILTGRIGFTVPLLIMPVC